MKKGTCWRSEHNLGSRVFSILWVPETEFRFSQWQQVPLPTEPFGRPSLFGACGGEARSLVTLSSLGWLGCSVSEPLGSTGLPVLRSLITQTESTSLPKDGPTWWYMPGVLVVRTWRRRWRSQGRPWLYQALPYPSPRLPRKLRC